MAFDWAIFFQDVFASYGLVGMFFLSLLINATIFFPVPVIYGFVFLLAGLIHSFSFAIALGLVTGVGAGIGEMSGYLLGRFGLKAVEKTKKVELDKVFEFESRLEKHGAWAVFVLAIIPVPFDFVGIAAGLIRFNFTKFLFATVSGKAVRYLLISLAGYFGVTIIAKFYGG